MEKQLLQHESCPEYVHPMAPIEIAQETKMLSSVALLETTCIPTNNDAIDQGDAKMDPHPISYVVSGVTIPNTLPYDPLTHAARLRVHLDECTKCVVWCIKAGPEYHPASEHRQKAPCNVGNFYFGQPPWLPDGSVNPLGVPP